MLEVNNIKKYYKKIKALDGVTFSVNKGDILGLLGTNGAGKSTTLEVLSTIIKPDSGSVTYKGEDILSNPKIIQSKLGYIPQDIALYPNLSAYDNLKFWGRVYGLKGACIKRRIAEVLRIIGFENRAFHKVENYSGGMKRRLNIGVALLHEPELIIMDEPTVGIDTVSREHILDTVINLNKGGMTIIYTSHYMEEIYKLCNKVCILESGKTTAFGNKEEVLA